MPSKTPHDQPTVLGLARLARSSALPPGDQTLYRRVAQLVELGPQHEFIIVPAGRGLAARFLAETTGASGSGVDADPALIESAAASAREAGLDSRLHFDPAPGPELPYKDDVFDLAIGNVGLSTSVDAARAVRELARVTKPMGAIVLIQPVWNRAVEPGRRDMLIEHLGTRPYLLVEWKQMLREAGVVELIVEDLTASANPWQPMLGAGGVVEDLLSFGDRAELLLRVLRQWGWRGVGQAIRGMRELRALVARERILGLALIKGTRWAERPAAVRPRPPTDGGA
ncbi:MAG: class I SAM-dependent methyltransferase [Longimicrobiales bacterium]